VGEERWAVLPCGRYESARLENGRDPICDIYGVYSNKLVTTLNGLDPKTLILELKVLMKFHYVCYRCSCIAPDSSPPNTLPGCCFRQKVKVTSISVLNYTHIRCRNCHEFYRTYYPESEAETHKRAKKGKKTINSRYSLVVTHPTTNRPAHGLSTAERTGSPVVHVLWSIAKGVNSI
jgi:hypothetical protein